MKIVLYIIYACLFYIYSLLPIKKNKTTFIMTHDASINGNIMRMYQKIKQEKPNEICKFITKKELNNKGILHKLASRIQFIFVSSFHLATSRVIFLDNVFLPMAFMRFKKKVKVVQLWHGCNTLKKFGQLSNVGQLKWLEQRANRCYTHLITSSKKMNLLHGEAFAVSPDKIYPVGLPRMDSLFQDNESFEKERELFYKDYPELRDKKIILYAPTFRDNDLEMLDEQLDLTKIVESLSDDNVLLTKFHPFVCKKNKEIKQKKLIDVSFYEDLNRLLIVADMLITDYSSIIFEYAILNKPIIFYAYDQDEYENKIRGFYYPYTEYVPGVIVRDRDELLKCILNEEYLGYQYNDFVEGYVDYMDNKATKRIYDMLY